MLRYILAKDRSGLILTFVMEMILPGAYSLPLRRNIPAISFWINLDTFFCLVDSTALYLKSGKGTNYFATTPPTLVEGGNGGTGIICNDPLF